MKMRPWLIVGLLLSLNVLSLARSPQKPEIQLAKSGPIVATYDGQVIQKKFIEVTGSDGILVTGKKNVTIRHCKIAYGSGFQGIRFSGAPGLRIEDCEIVCHNAPKTGKIEGHNSNCISGYQSNNVAIERVKMSDGSAGIYLLICDDSMIRTVEGHNLRGDFPRGQFIQFDKCSGGLVEHFSVINDPNIAYTEDNINCYKSGGQVFRDGLIQGNNSPSGVGILWEDQNDPKARGGFGGLVEDVDLVDMGNGACTGADGARDIIFRRVRIRDNHGQGQGGRDKGGSNGLVFSGYGAPDNRGKDLRVEQCTVYNLCNPNNLCWPRDSFLTVDVVRKDFKPRPPIVLSWNWRFSDARLVPVAKGWAKNSVNAVIFRRNSVVTHKGTQVVAFYDADSNVVLAKRHLEEDTWQIRKTQYRGNTNDAHNSISIMIDGDGFLHMSWDHHNHALRYCRSVSPGSLELTEKLPMTGKKEGKVTYPEFYRLSNGNLLFLYRDGGSGNGNLMMNHYDLKTKTWTQRQDAFIHGEGQRNAYWQMCTDVQGGIHISWVWRETGDIATNHDIGYAKSTDGGKTWKKSNGEMYRLPITQGNAEYAVRIPQNSELINTTSMCADAKGRPYIATYWRPFGTDVPQYHLVYHDGVQWHTQQTSHRTTPFRLSGGGTKRIPISRPQIFANSLGGTDKAYMLFRDTERQDRVSIAICDDLQKKLWDFSDLTDFSVGMWEPGYDTELWKRSKVLNVYVQKVDQGDGDRNDMSVPPTDISILEWEPQ